MLELHMRGLQINELPDISAVAEFNALDTACLTELREVIRRHGLTQKFGIALLHRHFELADDEVLLETCDVEGRSLLTRPVRRSEIQAGQNVTTLWKFVADGEAVDSERECEQVCPMHGTKHAGHKDHA